MLSLRELTIERGGKKVLFVEELAIQAGQVHLLLGRNGAGKSSLLLACAGLIASAGEILFEARPLCSMSVAERAQSLAFVPQVSRLDAQISVAEVISQGRFARDGYWRSATSLRAEVQVQAERCDIAERLDFEFPKLSLGQQRRVLLARALMQQTPILLLDEPLAGLDLAAQLRFIALIRELAGEGKTVLMSHHDLLQVAELGDRATLLHAGVAHKSAPANDILDGEALKTVFGLRRQDGELRLAEGE